MVLEENIMCGRSWKMNIVYINWEKSRPKNFSPEEPLTQDSIHSDGAAATAMCFAAAVVEKAAEVVGNVSAVKTENSC